MAQPQHSASSARSRNDSRPKELPPGFTSIQDLLDGSVSSGRMVSVVGLVKDYRLPISTRGYDWKSTMDIYDKSTEDGSGDGMRLNIFRPEQAMPDLNAGDVVVVFGAKIQAYGGSVSLLTHRSTAIHVYAADQIPKPPKTARDALKAPTRIGDRPPGDKEHEYVSWLYHAVDQYSIPDSTEFQMRSEASRNIKEKFSKLEDVQDGNFYDAIVHVVRDPYHQIDKATLWVSDYTENSNFYKFTWDAANETVARDGDPYGYISTTIEASKNWQGPYGKRAMQVTCFEPHSDFVMQEVKAGLWIRLRNLHIKTGHNRNNLEGYLREDRVYGIGRIQVDILDTSGPGNADPRLKEAIRRKRDYERTKKQQRKQFAAANTTDGARAVKRKAEDEDGSKGNSKNRRKRAREAAKRKAEEQEHKAAERLGLNELVKCESTDEPVFFLSSIVDPIPWTTTVNGEAVTLTLPFTCAKYRANVRVVDFRPRKLQDFTTWRKKTEYDLLSDNGESEPDSDAEGDDKNLGTLNRYTGPKIWEWTFALLLQDVQSATKGEKPARLWALVNNVEAQQLTDLDACDLRANKDILDQLREKLFQLWGNLEEQKTLEQQHQLANKERVAANLPPPESSPPRPASAGSHHHRRQRGAPDPDRKDSDTTENASGDEHQGNKSNDLKGDSAAGRAVSNKPFACCIRQYGVIVREPDAKKADAGEGKRWQRMFGLFGTKISG